MHSNFVCDLVLACVCTGVIDDGIAGSRARSVDCECRCIKLAGEECIQCEACTSFAGVLRKRQAVKDDNVADPSTLHSLRKLIARVQYLDVFGRRG